MKSFPPFSPILLAVGLLAASSPGLRAQTSQDPIAVARTSLHADRQSVVKEALQLTDTESGNFWPLYQQYRADMDKIGDALLKNIREYARYYPNVPDDRAQKLLSEYLALEKSFVSTRATYLVRFGKILPGSKAMRLAQVENRLDLAVRLAIASGVPVIPIEGELTPQAAATVAIRPTVPGGAVVKVVELRATVTAIDSANRQLTLLGQEGIRQTVTVGPEVANFPQIQVGDEVKVRGTEALVVQMADSGASAGDGAAAALATAPEGAKPAAAAGGTIQIVGTILAIDEPTRLVTLQFEDGSTHKFPVRADVDLSKRKAGERVVFRYSAMMAASVEKP